MFRTESSSRSVPKERMIILFHSTVLQVDGHLVEEFFNLRNGGRETERKGSLPKITKMSQEQDVERTLNLDFVAPALCHIPL